MDVMEIPFVNSVGIQRGDDGVFFLPFSCGVHNHLETVHAAAQYALAETASGDTLLALFPELAGQVVPVLRDSQLKFKRPAASDIGAYTRVSEEAVARFLEQLERKGRSVITVEVQIRDAADIVTCSGSFNWFVQRIGSA